MRRIAGTLAAVALAAGCNFQQAQRLYCEKPGRCAEGTTVEVPVRDLRQGAAGVRVVARGFHLSGATSAGLDPPVGTVTIESQGDLQLQLSVSIDHGADLYAWPDLVIRYEPGRPEDLVRYPRVFRTVPVVVGPGGTADGAGTYDSPLRTISQAAAVAESGDLIVLLAGTYSDAWPESQNGAPSTTATLRSGVSLEGTGPAEVFLQPAPSQTSHAAFHLRGTTNTLRNLTLRGFHRGVVVADGATGTLSNVRIEGATDLGLYVTGTGTADVTSAEVISPRNAGLWAEATATAVMRTSSLTGSDFNGVRVTNGAQVTLDRVSVDANGAQQGLDHCGVQIDQNARLTMMGGSASNNWFCGIAVAGSAQLTLSATAVSTNGTGGSPSSEASGLVLRGGSATLTGATISGNLAHGIAATAGQPSLTLRGGTSLTGHATSQNAGLFMIEPSLPQVSMRNTQISSNYFGIVVGAIGSFEGGSPTVAGNNQLSNDNFDLYDARPDAAPLEGVLIQLSETRLKGGSKPVARTYEGVYNEGRFTILGMNQRIAFYDVP